MNQKELEKHLENGILVLQGELDRVKEPAKNIQHVNKNHSLTRILRDLNDEYLDIRDLAKVTRLSKTWIQNKIFFKWAEGSKKSTSAIRRFKYRNTFYFNLNDFKKWNSLTYKKK